jgi:protein SCO1/2
MKKIFLLFSILFAFVSLRAQLLGPGNDTIGITEHLGETIPLDLKFLNEDSVPVTLGQLIDKPTILSFVYYDCPGICTYLQEGVSDLVANSDLWIGTDYNIITISFNYRDKPSAAILKKQNFTTAIPVDKRKNWHYLTGDSASINTILTSAGYKIKIAGLDFSHPSGIIILSPKGKITRYFYGLSYLPFDFKMAVIEAQKGLARPTINKVLEFCFSYDQEDKKYSLQVTKVAATIIIFFAVLLFLILIIRSKKRKNKQVK